MKKFSLILPGAIALLMVAAPFAVQARPVGSLAQQTQQQPKRNRTNALNLTDAQKQQAKAIRQETRSKIISEVLTPEQRNQLNAAQGQRGGWRSLNLTESQRTEIRNRMRAANERVEREVLTEAQRSQLQQKRSQMRQMRGNRPNV